VNFFGSEKEIAERIFYTRLACWKHDHRGKYFQEVYHREARITASADWWFA
jgi:hypothetical protein